MTVAKDEREAAWAVLLPCPFCGGEARRMTLGPNDGPDNEGGDVIVCSGVCGASSHVEFGRKESLVSLWNGRTATRPAPDQPRDDAAQGRECQAVWRCAIGDVTTAMDLLRNQWIDSKRKAERAAGEKLTRVLELVWAARDPAPSSYDDASTKGKPLIERVRAALANHQEGER